MRYTEKWVSKNLNRPGQLALIAEREDLSSESTPIRRKSKLTHGERPTAERRDILNRPARLALIAEREDREVMRYALLRIPHPTEQDYDHDRICAIQSRV